MKLDGVDAWALTQYIRPNKLFEASLEELGGHKRVLEHERWARQWWIQCMLGMDKEQAYQLARQIKSSAQVDELYPVDVLLFATEHGVLS